MPDSQPPNRAVSSPGWAHGVCIPDKPPMTRCWDLVPSGHTACQGECQGHHEWWGEGAAEKQVAQEGTEVEGEHWLGALDGQEQAPS